MAFSATSDRALLNLRRRDMLKTTGISALALLVGETCPWASALAQGPERPAQWPVTCRDVMLKRTEQPDCWAAMAAYGVDGVESDISDDLRLPSLYQGDRVFSVADEKDRQELKTALDTAKKRITAFCMHNRFEERPEFELEWCTKVAAAAKDLGVPAVRIDVVPRRLPREEFLSFAVNLLRKIMDATETTGIKFAIENHGNTTNDPAFLDAVFDGVGSPRLGLTLDTGNFYWFGHPLSRLYEIYERFASRAFHTHCKSIGYPPEMRDKERPMGWEYQKYHCPIDQGDIDFAKVIAILRKAGYCNDLCIENEGLGRLSAEQAIETVRKEVQLLRNLQSAVTQEGRFLPVARV
ncbi:MAG: sugar phosphate isomerase/epimerase family protein [Thermogutta sp.]